MHGEGIARRPTRQQFQERCFNFYSSPCFQGAIILSYHFVDDLSYHLVRRVVILIFIVFPPFFLSLTCEGHVLRLQTVLLHTACCRVLQRHWQLILLMGLFRSFVLIFRMSVLFLAYFTHEVFLMPLNSSRYPLDLVLSS